MVIRLGGINVLDRTDHWFGFAASFQVEGIKIQGVGLDDGGRA